MCVCERGGVTSPVRNVMKNAYIRANLEAAGIKDRLRLFGYVMMRGEEDLLKAFQGVESRVDGAGIDPS